MKNISIKSFLLFVLFTAAGCAPVTPEVAALLKQRDDLAALHEQAKAGSADAQYKLGGMYERGEGVHKQYAKAMKW